MIDPRPALALLALITSVGCASRGQLRTTTEAQAKALEELKAEQARQAGELSALRARLETMQRADAVRPEPARVDPPLRPPPARLSPDAALVHAIPIEDSPVDGPADAAITIVEFTDFQCPFCSRAQATLQELRQQLGNEARFVLKHRPLPFHEKAFGAAIAAECARAQGRFWPFEKILFERQAQLGDERYEPWAREVPGMDVARFKACVAKREPEARIRRDLALGDRVGVDGTPTFFINGRVIVGAQPIGAFRALIAEELSKARASGIPAVDYYRKAVEEAGVR
jgi:protein-disulfide isomerase